MDNVASCAALCRSFAENAFNFDYGPGLITGISDAHDAVESATVMFFHGAQQSADGLHHRVNQAVAGYEAADDHALERLGAAGRAGPQLIPVAQADADACIVSTGTLQDLHLVEVDEAALRMRHPYEPKWADIASPSSWLRDSVWNLTSIAAGYGLAAAPTDIYDLLVVPLVGNWAGLAALSQSLQQMADATDTVLLNNITVISGLVRAGWPDDTGQECLYWLQAMARRLEQGSHALRDLAVAYAGVVEAARKAETELEPIMVDLVDAVIAAVLAALTAPTLAGGATFAALSIQKILRVVRYLTGGQTLMNALFKDIDHGADFVKAVASIRAPDDGGFPRWPASVSR